jgi:hypothetical protein
MLIDRYFDNFFHNHRVPSRLVRYGIIYGGSAKDALNEVDPHAQLRELSKETNDMLKAGAKQLAARIATFIELLEEYEEATIDGPTEADDAKAEVKAKAKRKKKS